MTIFGLDFQATFYLISFYLKQALFAKLYNKLMKDKYRTYAIIARSWFETTLDYKPRIAGPTIEEFHFLVHKLSEIQTTLQYKPQWKMEVKNLQALAYNGKHMVYNIYELNKHKTMLILHIDSMLLCICIIN